MAAPVMKGFDLSGQEIERAWENDFPLNLSIYLSSQCNLSCVYCFAAGETRADKQLTVPEYEQIIDQAFDLGVTRVMFSGRGEPLLDAQLWELLEYVQAKGGWNLIFTNAIGLTSNIARMLWDRNVSVMTKINSFDPCVQDRLVGRSGAANEMYQGLQSLIDAGFNVCQPTRLANDNLICQANYREIPDMVEFFHRQNIQVVLETLLLRGRASENRTDLQTSGEQLHWLERELSRRGLGFTSGVAFCGQECIAETHTVMVNEFGEVMPCWGREGIEIGSVRHQSLMELWYSSTLAEARQLRRNHVLATRVGLAKMVECPGRCYARERMGL